MANPADVFAGAAGGLLFNGLYDGIKEVATKHAMFKDVLESVKTTLESLKKVVEDIAQLNEDLDRPKEEIDSLKTRLEEGKELVAKCLKVRKWRVDEKYKYSKKLLGYDDRLKKQLERLEVYAIRDGMETLTTVKRTEKTVSQIEWSSSSIKERVEQIETNTANLPMAVSRVEAMCLNIQAEMKQTQKEAKPEAWYAVPELPTLTVGLDGPLNELKMKLLNNGVSMVVLTAPGGCGKTTLATKFCQDKQVQEKFKNNIFFITVSETPDFYLIVQRLYRSKGNPAPTFKDDENALKLLRKFLKEEGQNPLLLVLDDVWSGSDSLLEKFEFKMQDYKVLVTSRSEFRRFDSYALQSLDFDNAMKLFHHAASLGEKSLDIPPDISRKVVEGCKGFPLAITVAGKSLCGQPIEIWQERLIKWSKHSSILDSETELLLCLKTSLDVLNKERSMVKECFLDLGSFPEDQRIPVAALIDIWTESYSSLDQDILCVANLHQITNRSLANLVVTRKDKPQGDGYYSEHFVTQHDLLRELAIYETRQEDPGHRERLIINISEDNFPKWWSEQKYPRMKARLLSISTDGSFSTKWHDMELPESEVLVLNFHTKNYPLPQFVEKMVKLKVLVVTNYGIVPSELTNFEILCTSSKLKRMRLERISIPSIAKHPMQLNSLQKISLFMCNIGQAFSNGSIQFSNAWPNLVEVNIDYCNDLVALPADTSDLIHLKKLSITNCHKLLALPEDIGKLAKLELLRLRSCTDLAKLPGSTGNLKKLKSLDISYCFSIKELPEDFGELSCLRELNMRDCSRLQELPLSVSNLEYLKVIGDDDTQSLWQPFLPIEGTHIVVAKENINLNWLPKFQF
ncbi:putative powdery mildew resistance protein, RPW8 [Rosa chinensis]|uniref:Putative powdery mildew resistance protein, RPW8 n=1 Tax=Rosa chinensis TaxID=74649 RepID=A0A2P6RN48_ROSCH|nr:probable disease resistance protein At5g66900 isoform X1 [Rosa chinensis]PRQ47858.1 putative powdery mildew resistance protein, RPW8 [Rosa chinensis]